jgi:succinoglycan biosynthesis protein ExoO
MNLPGETGAPDVSVIIPAWKAAGFVGRAVASALASTGVSIEVVVVDDASPDDTFDVLKTLATADERVVVDRLIVNGGPSAARNRALDLARGRYVAVLDADDTMSPGRLEALVALGDADGADILVDNMIEVDADEHPLGPAAFVTAPEFETARDISLVDYVRFNQPLKPIDCIGYLKPLFRRETLQRLALRYDPALRNSEDYYLVASLLASGARMRWTPEAGYLYQRSDASTSHRLKPEQTAAWLVAEDDFQARYRTTFSAKARDVLRMRKRLLRDVDQFVRAVDAMKARKAVTLAGLLAADPRASAFTLSMLTRIAFGKLTRTRQV